LLIAAAHADFPDSEIRIDTLAFYRVKKLATTVRLAQWPWANIAIQRAACLTYRTKHHESLYHVPTDVVQK